MNHGGSLVRVDVEHELCAGKKNYIPNYPVYTRMHVNGTKVRVLKNFEIYLSQRIIFLVSDLSFYNYDWNFDILCCLFPEI